MTLQDLIRRFRVLAKDAIEPHRAKTPDVVDWFNDAEEQACIRGRLLREDANPAVCRIPLVVGQHTYPLHAAVCELINVRIGVPGGEMRTVALKSREWLDAEVPNWRDDAYPAFYAVQDDTTIRLVGQVQAGEELVLECYRLPLVPMALPTSPNSVRDTPEIHRAHHVHLIQWALHRAFSVPDSQLFDAGRAALAEQAFTAYFGLMPDSDLRRSSRVDVAHHVRGYLQ